MSSPSTSALTRQSGGQKQAAKLNCRHTFGDTFHKSKKSSKIRIVFQNINGLGTTEETDKRDYIREFINTYNIDCLCMAEIILTGK